MKRMLCTLLACAALCADAQAAKPDKKPKPPPPPPPVVTEYYAAVNGLATNSGTLTSPWDLQTALDAPLQAGNLLYLRGGIYVHPDRSVGSKGYHVRLQGASGNPIIVKPYQQERAIIDGGLQSYDAAPGHDYRLQGLEVVVGENLVQNRTSTNIGSDAPPDLLRPWGGCDFRSGSGVEIVGCWIHDNMQGVGHWGNCSGLVYGNVIVRNGWIGPDRKHGHGVYAQNATGVLKTIKNNLLVDNYSLNCQCYGSSAATVDNVEFSDNAFVRGTVTDDGHVLIGGENQTNNIFVERNFGGWTLNVGYTGAVPPGDGMVIRGNWIWGDLGVKPGYTNLTKPIGSNLWWQDGWGKPRTEGSDGDRIGVDIDPPASPLVNVIPSAFDSHTANISILNFPAEAATTASVDLSGIVPGGAVYRVFSPYDLWGTPVLIGTYGGGGITVPISGRLTCYVLSY